MRVLPPVVRLELLLLRRAAGGPLLLYGVGLALLRFGPRWDLGPDYALHGAGFLAPVAVAFAVVIGQTALLPVRWTLPLRPGPLLAARLLLWSVAGLLAILPLLFQRTGDRWTGAAAAVGMSLSGVAAGAMFLAVTPSGGWKGADRTSGAFLVVVLLLIGAWALLGASRSGDSWTTAGASFLLLLLGGAAAFVRESRRESRPRGGSVSPGGTVDRGSRVGRSPRHVQAILAWGGTWGWAGVVLLGLLAWIGLVGVNGGLGVGPVWAALWDRPETLCLLCVVLLVGGPGMRSSPVFGFLPVPRAREFRLRFVPPLLLLLLSGAVVVADAGNRKFPSLDRHPRNLLTYRRGDHLHGVPPRFADAGSPEDLAGRVVPWVEERYGVTVEAEPVRLAAREGWILFPFITPQEARTSAIARSLRAIDPVLVPDLRRAARERALFGWLLLLTILGIQLRGSAGRWARRMQARYTLGNQAIGLALLLFFLLQGLDSGGMETAALAILAGFQRSWPFWTLAWAAGLCLLWRSCERAWARLDGEDLGLAEARVPDGDL